VQHPDQRVHIKSDSSYCVDGYNKWIFEWVASSWVKSDGRPVLNNDMWEIVWCIKCQIKELNLDCKVSWVRGHDGHDGNEAADQLAKKGVTLHPRYVAPVNKKRSSKKKTSGGGNKSSAEKKPDPIKSISTVKRKADLL
jgi:ribonuclease HI